MTQTRFLSPLVVERVKLSDQVFDAICEAIVNGTLPPGTRLTEAHLARMLNTSRMPVREALARLERGHLIQRDAAGTCYVARWDTQMLWEVATLRGALEGLAVNLAIKQMTAEDLDVLEGLVSQMDKAVQRGNHDRLISLDIEFHSCIWGCTGHRLLQEALEEIRPQVRYFMYVTRPGDESSYPATHWELIAALREGDAARVETLIREHTLTTAMRSIAQLREQDDELGQTR